MQQKPFIESLDTAVFTTRFVMNDKKDITVIFHYADDGAWQFSSNDEIEDLEETVMVVGLAQIIALDPTILEVSDLPPGYRAEREFKGDKWVIAKLVE